MPVSTLTPAVYPVTWTQLSSETIFVLYRRLGEKPLAKKK